LPLLAGLVALPGGGVLRTGPRGEPSLGDRPIRRGHAHRGRTVARRLRLTGEHRRGAQAVVAGRVALHRLIPGGLRRRAVARLRCRLARPEGAGGGRLARALAHRRAPAVARVGDASLGVRDEAVAERRLARAPVLGESLDDARVLTLRGGAIGGLV